MNTTHAVAGIDPHKHTATVAIVDVLGVLVTSLSVRVTKSGIDALTALLKATEMTIDRIGVEGSGGLGRPVMLALAAAGYDVREVQANRTAQRRKRRRRTKTDIEDAEAIARETLAEADLPPAGKDNAPPPAADQLAAVRDWRESLVLQRVRLLNEAEAVLVSLPLQLREQLPANSRVSASLDRLARLEDIRPDLGAADRVKLDRLAQTRADVASIGARIKELDSQVPALLKTLGCTLTVIHGRRRHRDDTDDRDRRPAPLRHRGTVRPLVRRRPGGPVIRRGRRPSTAPPPRPRREPQGQLDAAHRPHHPGPLPPAGPGLHGQTRNRAQDQTGRPASPQTAARQRHYPPHVERLRPSRTGQPIVLDRRCLTRELRVAELPTPQDHQEPWALPQRRRGDQASLARHPRHRR